MKISIIAAIGKNRELGYKNQLIWKISSDLQRLKKLTTGHPIIMGRKTYESIGRLLPGRTNIIVSRSQIVIPDSIGDPDKNTKGIVANSVEDAIEKAKSEPGSEEIFIFGGAQIFQQAIKHADRLYLTIINAEAPMADTYFPDYSEFKKITFSEKHNEDGLEFEFVNLDR